MQAQFIEKPFGPFEFHKEIEPILGIGSRRIRQLVKEDRIVHEEGEGGWMIACPKLQRKALILQGQEIIEEVGQEEKKDLGNEPKDEKATEILKNHLVTKEESMLIIEKSAKAEAQVKIQAKVIKWGGGLCLCLFLLTAIGIVIVTIALFDSKDINTENQLTILKQENTIINSKSNSERITSELNSKIDLKSKRVGELEFKIEELENNNATLKESLAAQHMPALSEVETVSND